MKGKKKGSFFKDDEEEEFSEYAYDYYYPQKRPQRPPRRQPGVGYVLFQALLGIVMIVVFIVALIVSLELLGFPRWADWWINQIVRTGLGHIRMNALTSARVLYLLSIAGMIAICWLSCMCCCRCCFNDAANEWFALLSLLGGCFIVCSGLFGPYTAFSWAHYLLSWVWSLTGGLVFG